MGCPVCGIQQLEIRFRALFRSEHRGEVWRPLGGHVPYRPNYRKGLEGPYYSCLRNLRSQKNIFMA